MGNKGGLSFLNFRIALSFIYLYVYLSTPFLGGSVVHNQTLLMNKRHHYVHPIKIY